MVSGAANTLAVVARSGPGRGGERGEGLVVERVGEALVAGLPGQDDTFGAGRAGDNAVAGAFRQDYCAPETLVRVTATMKVVLFSINPFGALLGGLAGAWLGPRGALWITMGAGMLPAVLLLLSPVRSLRDLPGRGAGSLVPHGEDGFHARARHRSEEPGVV